jgi:hypothetical protein
MYTVAHSTREESDGSVAVEILSNESYEELDDRGQQITGQYTHKIYHIGGYSKIVP